MNLTLVGGAASGQDSNTSSATQKHPLGTMAYDRLGRKYRYTQAVAATVAGSLYQATAPIANHLANTPPAVAIGATSFSYTPGATGGAANLYAEGLLQVDTTPDNGYTYGISGHAAITASVAFTLNLYPEDPIQAVALTTSSRVGLLAHPFKNTIVAPTTLTAQVVGWAVGVIATSEYGWLLTRGIVSALINGTPAVTAPVMNSATTAGAVDVWTAANQPTSNFIGHMAQLGVSTKNNFVYALLD